MSRYLDDWTVGEQFITPGRTVCECDVNLFAGLTGDMHQNHTDASYMENSQFGKRIAHGLLIMAMSHGLMMRLNIITDNSIALLSVDDWQFHAPVFFGDTIHVLITVADIHMSRTKPDRGILKLHFDIRNQEGGCVQSGTKVLMMKRKLGKEQ